MTFSSPNSNSNSNNQFNNFQVNEEDRKEKNKLAARKARVKKNEDKSKVEQNLKQLEENIKKKNSKINKLTHGIYYLKSIIEKAKVGSVPSATQFNVTHVPSVANTFNVPLFFDNPEEKISKAVECVDQENNCFLNKIPGMYESSLPLDPSDLECLADLELPDEVSIENFSSNVQRPAPETVDSFDQDVNTNENGSAIRTFPGTSNSSDLSILINSQYNSELNPIMTWLKQAQQSTEPNNCSFKQPLLQAVSGLIDLSFINNWDTSTVNCILQKLPD